MRLEVYTSFEPAALERVLAFWNDKVVLFSSVSTHRPEMLSWGATSEIAADELRVFLLDPSGLRMMVEGGLPSTLQAGGGGRAPIVALLPDEFGTPDPQSLRGARLELLDVLGSAEAAGVQQFVDAESRQIAGVPYTDEAFAAIGTTVFRRAYSLLAPAVKVLALDCDGTLWQGLCAEQGPLGVHVGPEERWLHDFLAAQKRAGRLLVLVSKNIEEDVEAVFMRRNDLGFRWSDFAAVRLGWGDKPSALRELADELNLGLDTFLFLDDSPAECAEVSAVCNEVAVINRPHVGVQSCIEAAWPLDARPDPDGVLGEARTMLYREEALRRAARRTAPSFADHVRSLDVRTILRVATAAEEARLFELAQRTNQFHTASDRPSAQAVRERVVAGELLSVAVADRFGDYGISGAIFLERRGDVLRATRFLLSCRVLGRGVEEDVFDGLVALARKEGLAALEIAFTYTGRNLPARQFLTAIGEKLDAAEEKLEDGSVVWRFDLADIRPCPRLLMREEGVRRTGDAASVAPAPNWIAVADLTRDMRALVVTLGLSVDVGGQPTYAGDEGILRVAADVLGRPVAREDNLYALGADSLRIVRLLARLKSRLGLDLPIGEVLHRADVSDLLELGRRARPNLPPLDTSFFDQVQSLYEDDKSPQ